MTIEQDREDRVWGVIVPNPEDDKSDFWDKACNLAWFSYLEATLTFPFTARSPVDRALFHLTAGEELEVLGLPDLHHERHLNLLSNSHPKPMCARASRSAP